MAGNQFAQLEHGLARAPVDVSVAMGIGGMDGLEPHISVQIDDAERKAGSETVMGQRLSDLVSGLQVGRVSESVPARPGRRLNGFVNSIHGVSSCRVCLIVRNSFTDDHACQILCVELTRQSIICGMARTELVRSDAGRFVGAKDLTRQQWQFVLAITNDGLTGKAAAERAGYAEASVSASQLMRNPRVLAAIRDEQTRTLGTELATKAIGYLRVVMDMDETVEDQETGQTRIDSRVAKLKLDAAKTILDRAGHIAPKAQEIKSADKRDLEDYTTAEIEDMVRRTRETLDAMTNISASQVVEGESSPVDAPEVPETGGNAGETPV